MAQERISLLPAVASNVDMLRLEYPASAVQVYTGDTPPQPSIDLKDPPAWLRLLVSQQRQAQWDLEQLHTVCGSTYDRSDRRIQRIEETYTQITGALEYVYGQAQANARASSDWMQTELMRTANAAQKFTNDVWTAIQLRDQEKTNEDINRYTRILRVKDAVQFLQVASQQRLEEQSAWNQNCEDWAVQQQAATARLAAQQQALETQVSALISTAAKKKQKRNPTYLQSAAPAPTAAAAPSISSLPGAAPRSPTPAPQTQGGVGPGGPPLPPPTTRRPGRASRSPSLPPLPPSSGGYTPPPQSPPPQAPIRNVLLSPAELREIVTATVTATQTALQAGQANVAKLKLKDPKEFDGKTATPFTLWWESVCEYIEFYPRCTDAQRIAWIGTLLTGTA